MTNGYIVTRLNSWRGPLRGWLPTPTALALTPPPVAVSVEVRRFGEAACIPQ